MGSRRIKMKNKLRGQVLSDAALRNIDVDSIANDYLLDTRQPQTQDNAAHVDAQAISISIQGTRITGRYEDAIREHIDGSYLRHYLSAKHNWTDSTWSWIDWYSHERHLKVLKGACLFQRLKFIHDWQPTNSHKLKLAKSDEYITIPECEQSCEPAWNNPTIMRTVMRTHNNPAVECGRLLVSLMFVRV